jgi:hypothetical protein
MAAIIPRHRTVTNRSKIGCRESKMPPATLERTTKRNGKAAAAAREIPTDQIGESPTNPRLGIDDDSLTELTASMLEYGLLLVPNASRNCELYSSPA